MDYGGMDDVFMDELLGWLKVKHPKGCDFCPSHFIHPMRVVGNGDAATGNHWVILFPQYNREY